MMKSPKSLTAVIHIKFNYPEPEDKPVNEADMEMLSRILDRAAELEPELQELIVKFANHLCELSKSR